MQPMFIFIHMWQLSEVNRDFYLLIFCSRKLLARPLDRIVGLSTQWIMTNSVSNWPKRGSSNSHPRFILNLRDSIQFGCCSLAAMSTLSPRRRSPSSALRFYSARTHFWATPLLSLIHISEPTRQAEISYAVFCLKFTLSPSNRKNPYTQ